MKRVYELDVYKLADELSDMVWHDFDKWNKKIQNTVGYQNNTIIWQHRQWDIALLILLQGLWGLCWHPLWAIINGKIGYWPMITMWGPFRPIQYKSPEWDQKYRAGEDALFGRLCNRAAIFSEPIVLDKCVLSWVYYCTLLLSSIRLWWGDHLEALREWVPPKGLWF